MRSDYYTLIQPDAVPPIPPTPPKKKRRGHALPLFLCFLFLLTTGTGFLAWQYGLPSLTSPWDLLPTPDFHDNPYSQLPFPTPAPVETTIRKLAAPGESTLTLLEKTNEGLSAADIYARVSPAILSVTAEYDQGGGAEGTGVIFDERGYFITNAHVITGASRVNITLSNGREYPAYLIGMDEQTDLAVLKFSASNLTVAPFGSDLNLVVGEDAYAIGNPLGSRFRGSITEGIISGIDRSIHVDGYDMTLIQTSAAINTGSSGGALVNTDGQVVGITNMKMMSWQSTVEGLGFAIPSTTVEAVVGSIMKQGYVSRPVLGITVRPARVPEECSVTGLYVDDVHPFSDAYAQGLRPGDVLVSANDTDLKRNDDLLAERTGLDVGDTITLSWLPGGTGTLQTADITLVEQSILTAGESDSSKS